jgi:dTDP-4-dehydrorhamnose reductase
MTVLITGANGQLGQCLKIIEKKFLNLSCFFLDSSALDITNLEDCYKVFNENKPNFVINTAAYTAVDLAENEIQKANLVNHIGAENLAKVCKIHNSTLIHISTDYVFDGQKEMAYTECDTTNPISIYGKTKLAGEQAIINYWHKHLIIRTSWLYSDVGKNFYLSMLNLAKTKKELNIVNDQIGSPTNAYELANSLLKIISFLSKKTAFNDYGIYHFTQKNSCSWYDFAKEIFYLNQIDIQVNPIPTSTYPTPAKRPAFSLLDTSKIEEIFDLNILTWQDALKNNILNKS